MPLRTEPDEKGNIEIPDELMPLFNSLGMQLRLHVISGKNEILTVAHMLQYAQMFFKENPELVNG